MKKHFMISIENSNYESSLEIRKVYEIINDKGADKHNQIRVIDESGEDYLYPKQYFDPIRLPIATKEKIASITT